jgi:hypothetical protein
VVVGTGAVATLAVGAVALEAAEARGGAGAGAGVEGRGGICGGTKAGIGRGGRLCPGVGIESGFAHCLAMQACRSGVTWS